MNKLEFNTFVKEVEKYHKGRTVNFTNYRLGQSYMYVLQRDFPMIYDEVVESGLSCLKDDNKIDVLLKRLTKWI